MLRGEGMVGERRERDEGMDSYSLAPPPPPSGNVAPLIGVTPGATPAPPDMATIPWSESVDKPSRDSCGYSVKNNGRTYAYCI